MNTPPAQYDSKSIGALICGVLSIISFGAFPVPALFGIAAIILGGQALKRPGANRGLAQIGRALGCLGIIIPVILVVFLGMAFALFAF